MFSFIGALIVGGLAGWIASMIMKTDTGILMNIVLGILGAAFLNTIGRWIGLAAETNWFGQMIVGAAGACALIAIYRAVKSRA